MTKKEADDFEKQLDIYKKQLQGAINKFISSM